MRAAVSRRRRRFKSKTQRSDETDHADDTDHAADTDRADEKKKFARLFAASADPAKSEKYSPGGALEMRWQFARVGANSLVACDQ